MKLNFESRQLLVEELLPLFESLDQKIEIYLHGVQKSKKHLSHSFSVSLEELWNDLTHILNFMERDEKVDLPMEVLSLYRDVIGSSIWILRSYVRFLKSFLMLNKRYKLEHDHYHRRIIHSICEKQSFDESEFTADEIFEASFRDLCMEHDNPHYESRLSIPKTNITICLVSGVLNEIYKTAAFERGVSNLSKKMDIDYIVPDVHGRKSTTHNAKMLEKALFPYIDENPEKKLWIIGHSKGGIDALHFIRRNTGFSSKNIIGLSTIASPILGSPNAESLVAKTLNTINKLDRTKIYQKIDDGRDLLMKNIPRFLSENFQKRWFERNHESLPKELFYTSLALQSKWYETHVYMILAKLVFRNRNPNDGVVDIERAHFPESFDSLNLGSLNAHHLAGSRSSTFNQEALIGAHIITLSYLGLLD